MKVINFFGGPGCGKSTTAAYLFSRLKMNNRRCQYVNEYAKQCVYEKRELLLTNDQLYVLAKQNHKLTMLKLGGDVEFAIVDSPLLLSNIYGKINNSIPQSFHNLTLDYFKSYDNVNFFVQRTQNYEVQNRLQNLNQAKKIDVYIKNYLINHDIFFQEIFASMDVITQIKESVQLRQILN